MKKEKQLIERNLKFANKYIYLSLTRGNFIDGQCTSCDNCGKLISNMVEVQNFDTGKKHMRIFKSQLEDFAPHLLKTILQG